MNRHDPPFIVDNKGTYHLVTGIQSGYYWTICGLRFNHSTIEEDEFDAEAKTKMSPRDVEEDDERSPCGNCKRTKHWLNNARMD